MNEEKAREAYEFLMIKYPTAPSINPEIIKHKIRFKFGLNEKEVYAAYYGWKRKVTEIIDKPKFKEIKERKIKTKHSFMWSKNLEKLKELHERYKLGENIENLAAEVGVSRENILNAFTRYKKIGVLHGEPMFRRNFVIIDGKKFTTTGVKELILRINDGEEIKDLAEKLDINTECLRRTYYYHRDKFIEQ
ncbi:hypothetical protein QJR26_08875 [Clostridium baratii]